jgi:hypothetical protein
MEQVIKIFSPFEGFWMSMNACRQASAGRSDVF